MRALVNQPLAALRDPHPWRTPLLVGLIVIVAGMGISLAGPFSVFGVHFWVPPEAHERVWIVPTDFWWAVRGAAYIANGALGYMYEAARPYYGLPLFPLLLAPFVFVGERLGLATGAVTPGEIAQPHMWLILGPVVFAAVVPLIYGGRRLMRTLGISPTLRTELWLVVLAFGPALWPGGHVEDVLSLAFVMIAVSDALDGRSIRAALFFALAIATKQWALVGLPLFLVLTPTRDRLRAFMASVSLPALLAGFVLLVDFPDARYSLMQGKGFVVLGRKAPFAISIGGPYVLTSPFRLATLAGGLLLAFLLRKRLRRDWVPAAFGICFLIRFLLEPTPPAYSISPCLAFLLIDERLRRSANVWVPLLGMAVLLAFALPGSVVWWVLVAVASLACAAPAIARLAHTSDGVPAPRRIGEVMEQ